MNNTDMKIPKEKCIKCKGNGGFIKGVASKRLNSYYWVRCNKCEGKRELDWVEMTMASRPITNDNIIIPDPVLTLYCIDLIGKKRIKKMIAAN
jgi:hypothetical protein